MKQTNRFAAVQVFHQQAASSSQQLLQSNQSKPRKSKSNPRNLLSVRAAPGAMSHYDYSSTQGQQHPPAHDNNTSQSSVGQHQNSNSLVDHSTDYLQHTTQEAAKNGSRSGSLNPRLS